MKKKSHQAVSRHFPLVPLAQANRRVGRHHEIVAHILSDFTKVDQYSALKIDLAKVGKKKAHLRAALLRAAKKKRLRLATASDEKYLYVFRSSPTDEDKSIETTS
jgi:hypothetical protein